ncbi:hypothetical protein BpHYR1_011519 [Brachionus plicatilis]|uniref:RNA-directed DNA polymerase from mobile element jockey-like n=1 Tax=Brachionus plicatilis TaxID=10195 RepID=A0A3M7QZ67_BRAPC|nr:hypothetical protein BpHYR1_011519 [Brachionus plicatilis]
MYEYFLDKYNFACNRFIPIYQSNKKKKFSPLMRRDIKSGLRRRFSAWEAFKKSGWNAQKKIVYNRAKKEAERLVKEGVKSYEESIAGSAKSNPKELYRYVDNKSCNGFREVIKALKNSDGVVSNDPKGIADFLNKRFQSIFSRGVPIANFHSSGTTFKCKQTFEGMPQIPDSVKRENEKLNPLSSVVNEPTSLKSPALSAVFQPPNRFKSFVNLDVISPTCTRAQSELDLCSSQNFKTQKMTKSIKPNLICPNCNKAYITYASLSGAKNHTQFQLFLPLMMIIPNYYYLNNLIDFDKTNDKKFKVLHLNINSLIFKFPEIKQILNLRIFDIIMLNETKLDEAILNSFFANNFYSIIRRDCRSNYGGVASLDFKRAKFVVPIPIGRSLSDNNNLKIFEDLLSSTDFSVINKFPNIDDKWDTIKELILNALEKSCTVRNFKKKSDDHCPWMDKELMDAKNYRDYFHQLSHTEKHEHD